jgi:uncharacterized protein YhbP (UPF0306 family)
LICLLIFFNVGEEGEIAVGHELRDQVLNYLRHHQVMTLATCGAEGPWAAAVFYVNKEFALYFLSAGHTRHVQNLQQEPRVAAAIQEDYRDWPEIKGIQLEGIVDELSGQQRRQAQSLYERKYPFLKNADPQIRSGLARINWYRLKPTRLYFIDNSKGLGHRDAVSLS